MNPTWLVRTATPEDVDRVESLLVAADLPIDGLRDQFGDGFAVVELDGAIIGVAGVEIHGPDGLLRSAAVDPAWRGRAVGDALTRDRIAWSRRRGLRSLYLLTTTAGDWFPRFGFRPASRTSAPEGIRRSREFSHACPATALFMCLQLESEDE